MPHGAPTAHRGTAGIQPWNDPTAEPGEPGECRQRGRIGRDRVRFLQTAPLPPASDRQTQPALEHP